jgi:hypothetical protein
MDSEDDGNHDKISHLASSAPEQDEEGPENLAIIEARAKANVAAIQEVGEQLKAIADSPGMKALLEGAGQALSKRWDYETKRLEKDYEQKMQADRLAAEAQKRRDILGTVLVGVGVLVFSAGATTIVVLVAKGIVTPGQAAVITGIVASLATGLGFGRKMRTEK